MFSWFTGSRTPIKDDIEKLAQAEKELNAQGVNPPEKPNRMDCAPDPNKMLEAINYGMDMGELVTERARDQMASTTMDQFMDTGWGVLAKVSEQLFKDTIGAQQCMDTQDQQHSQKMEQYIANVKKYQAEKAAKLVQPLEPTPIIEPVPVPVPAPAPRPAPITPQFVNVQGRWMGQNGVVQDWGGNMGPGCSGNENGIDRDSSGATGCHNDLETGQCRPDTCYDLKF